MLHFKAHLSLPSSFLFFPFEICTAGVKLTTINSITPHNTKTYICTTYSTHRSCLSATNVFSVNARHVFRCFFNKPATDKWTVHHISLPTFSSWALRSLEMASTRRRARWMGYLVGRILRRCTKMLCSATRRRSSSVADSRSLMGKSFISWL